MKSVWYRWLIVFIVSMSGDGWSYEASVVSGIFQLPVYMAHLGYANGLPVWANQLIGPVYTLGQLFGGLIAGWVGDRFGRKSILLIGTVCTDISITLLVWSPDIPLVIIARIIQGLSIGFLLLGYQIYAAEISGKNERGLVSGISLINGNVIALLASGLMYGVTYSEGNWGWRAVLSVSFIPANILLIALPFLPESPRWLYEQGRNEEALKVMIKCHGENGRLSSEVEAEVEAVKSTIAYEKENNRTSWWAFVDTPSARKRTLIALSSQLVWAFNGQSVFTYYYTSVFIAAGITDIHWQYGINAIQEALIVIGSFFGSYLLDITGRRFSFLFGIGQMAICLFIQFMLSCQYFDKGINSHAAGISFVVVYVIQWILWITFFSPVVNLYPAEIFSSPLRSRGFSIGNAASMTIGFVAQYTGLPMYLSLKGWTWCVFGCTMVFWFFIILYFYPETKCKTLEEIDELFESDLKKKRPSNDSLIAPKAGYQHVN